MSFGFSIGDIITCTQLAAQTYNALKTASKDFEGLRLDVRSLNATLKALADEERCPTSLIHTASPSRREDLRMLLENCTKSMDDLQGAVIKYSSLASVDKRKFSEWLRFASKDKQGPREKLAIHTASINMFLTTLSHGSLGRVEFLLKNSRPSHIPNPLKPPKGSTGFGTLGPRDANPQATAWTELENDMSTEGITSQHVEKFQEELKSYLRYLVRGETPFWIERRTARVQSARHREADTRNSVKEELERYRIEKQAKQLEEGRMERLKLEERRKAEREEATRSDKVSQLIDEFESLFDLDHDTGLEDETDVESINALPEEHDYPYDNHVYATLPGRTKVPHENETPPVDLKVSPFVKEKAKQIREDRQKLEKLVAKRDRARKEGDQMILLDIEMYAIPETTKRLEDLGCRFECNHCDLLIGGKRFHCAICDQGNWDICETCRKEGKRCQSSKHMLKQVSLEEDLRNQLSIDR
ncbi:hypothetical protein SLS60_008093 [Paraconiothyrium brasiliense]|uniref:ZZ-type domain-containing protein n=1 Tax=Paraconiothyrium brasiliense TaxID=300254 RepID=A0ABR3R407_9PLEO